VLYTLFVIEAFLTWVHNNRWRNGRTLTVLVAEELLIIRDWIKLCLYCYDHKFATSVAFSAVNLHRFCPFLAAKNVQPQWLSDEAADGDDTFDCCHFGTPWVVTHGTGWQRTDFKDIWTLYYKFQREVLLQC